MSTRRLLGSFYAAALCAFAVIACDSTPAYAGDKFQPVSQDELKMTGDPQAPGAPAIILYRQVDRDDTGLTAH